MFRCEDAFRQHQLDCCDLMFRYDNSELMLLWLVDFACCSMFVSGYLWRGHTCIQQCLPVTSLPCDGDPQTSAPNWCGASPKKIFIFYSPAFYLYVSDAGWMQLQNVHLNCFRFSILRTLLTSWNTFLWKVRQTSLRRKLESIRSVEWWPTKKKMFLHWMLIFNDRIIKTSVSIQYY